MKMVPFYSLDGVLIGHVNRDMCRQTHNSFVIDNGPSHWFKCPNPVPVTAEDISPIELFHIRFRKIEFRCRSAYNDIDATVYHLVVDEGTLPSWFWKAKAVVIFIPGSWQPVHP